MANEMIVYGLSDMIQGTKLALRSALFFGYGHYMANMAGNAKVFEAEMRTAILGAGKVKSEASARVSQAKKMSAVFGERFGKELATAYESDAHRVQACYLVMTAAGVTSIKKMLDWLEHGDANHSAKVEAEKAAAKEKAAAEAAATIVQQAVSVAPLDLDAVPEVSETKPEAVSDAGSGSDPVEWAETVAAMDDATLEAIRAAVVAEVAKRTRAKGKGKGKTRAAA